MAVYKNLKDMGKIDQKTYDQLLTNFFENNKKNEGNMT